MDMSIKSPGSEFNLRECLFICEQYVETRDLFLLLNNWLQQFLLVSQVIWQATIERQFIKTFRLWLFLISQTLMSERMYKRFWNITSMCNN